MLWSYPQSVWLAWPRVPKAPPCSTYSRLDTFVEHLQHEPVPLLHESGVFQSVISVRYLYIYNKRSKYSIGRVVAYRCYSLSPLGPILLGQSPVGPRAFPRGTFAQLVWWWKPAANRGLSGLDWQGALKSVNGTSTENILSLLLWW